MNGVSLEIRAPTIEHAERLAAALRAHFDVDVVSGGSYTVRVSPDSETTEKLVTLFNAIGLWLSEGGLASSDIKFGARSLTILPATAENLGDPTAFLIERTRQLEHALSSRIVIEQAKGVLAERLRIGLEEAFELLRKSARNGGRKIHDVARQVVRGEADIRA